jgi:hypothetical protein
MLQSIYNDTLLGNRTTLRDPAEILAMDLTTLEESEAKYGRRWQDQTQAVLCSSRFPLLAIMDFVLTRSNSPHLSVQYKSSRLRLAPLRQVEKSHEIISFQTRSSCHPCTGLCSHSISFGRYH